MPGNRKATEQFILKYVDAVVPGGQNKRLYEEKFSKMSDQEFEDMINGLMKKEVFLPVIVPNFSKIKLDFERNCKIAEELGLEFFKRINIPEEGDIPAYQTPIEYLVMDLPLRRQAQLVAKKISIPEDNNSIDDFTHQPTGKSKGSRLSYPEVQVLGSMGLNNSLIEFMKYRGGDMKGLNAMNTSIARTGGVSLKAIEPFAGGVKATATLSAYLNAMHLKNTL